MKLQTLVIAVSLFFATSAFSPVFAKQCIWNKAGFILNISWVKDENVVRKDQIALGQGNCSDDQGYSVVLSIQDGKLASDFTKVFVESAAALLGLPGGSELADQIPDAKQVFYVGTPSSDRYLDVWGTVWEPQTGPGGPIN